MMKAKTKSREENFSKSILIEFYFMTIIYSYWGYSGYFFLYILESLRPNGKF